MGIKIEGLVKFVPNAGGAQDANLSISNASYSGTSLDISTQDSRPEHLFFTANGTRMFVMGNGSDRVLEYTLGTGFDLSTASYASVSFDVSLQDNAPQAVLFNAAGTRMFILGGGTSDRVYQYTLSTGFDLSTASYDGVSFDVSGQDTFPTGFAFNSTGTRMFVSGFFSNSIYQYTLSTGFDLSTASYNSVSFDISSQEGAPRGIFFNSVGTKLFMIGSSSDRVHQYTLSTGFDLSTASYDSVSFDVSGQDIFPTGIFFNPTGTKMFMTGANNDSVYEYDL
jgi:DNA-binding beta-propeller fold protein YncE